MASIHGALEYVPWATRVDSSIDEVLAGRKGVCQDFSHVFLAVLRRLGLPARYVSGYLAPAASADTAATTPIATHAWVEVCLPELGWVGVDPTHNILTGTRHVRVAIGRDYADVPPTRGVFKGHADSTLTVAVDVAPAGKAPRLVVSESAVTVWSTPSPPPAYDRIEQQ
jgi:transglutaminase-like putative cysteine protease